METITTQGNKGLFTTQFLNKYYGIANCQAIDKPCDTITTVDRFALVTPIFTNCMVKSKENDSHYTRLIKEFCKEHNISDIFMRMLDVDSELKVIQGFPKDYVLLGTQTQRKKFVGNSVVPVVMEKIINKICR